MEEYATAATPDSQFRVWIAAQAAPEALPVRMLQNSVKALVDTPKVCSFYYPQDFLKKKKNGCIDCVN